MKWFACEMHCHTLNSDGDFTVKELMTEAKKYDLSGIALTDHNTTAGHSSVTDELEAETVYVLKGIEWTTYFGHMLVTGCREFVDWRDAVPDNIDKKTDEIKRFGGMIGIAHPFELGSPMCTGGFWEYNVHKWENIDYIEVWSKPFPASKSANERAMKMWSDLLDKGYHIAATYGKDWHRHIVEDVPSACTYIGTMSESLCGEEIKNSVMHGRTAVTMGPFINMTVNQNGTLYNIGDTISAEQKAEFLITVDETARRSMWEKFGFVLKEIRIVGTGCRVIAAEKYSESTQFEVDTETGWYRAELWGEVAGVQCEIAFTSPVYCK